MLGISIALDVLAIGCHKAPAPVDATPPARDLAFKWQEKPLGGASSRAPMPVAVREGVPPLVYLSEMPQSIRVTDRSTDEVLAETTVGARTIVRIDVRNGVHAGADELFAGPLPPGRRYAIYVLPPVENLSRTGRFEPRQAPTAEPAAESDGGAAPPADPAQ